MSAPIVVVDYGMGNIHSIVKALRLYAPEVLYTGDPAVIASARALVLPGDGAFAAAMQGLAGTTGAAVLGAVRSGTPLLGVCIGFQVLFENSDEVDGAHTHTDSGRTVAGLGLVPGRVRRFRFGDPRVRVPHMGWNPLVRARGPTSTDPEDAVADGEYMYFIHSYRAEGVPEEHVVACCDYAGDRFPAVVRHKNILATQYHPEKSDRAGLALLAAWVKSV